MEQIRILLTLGLIGIMIFMLHSCMEEKFIPDSSDPRLPKYTENGNQVGGALINDVAWKTNFWTSIDMGWNRSFYFTNYAGGDSVTITLDGTFTEGVHKEMPISFIVVLKDLSLEKLEDIQSLDGQTFVLDGTSNHVVVDDRFWTIQENTDYYYGGTGKITFKEIKTVKNTTIERQDGEKYNPLIVAGTFEFDIGEISTSIKLGRFDFYINDSYLDQK